MSATHDPLRVEGHGSTAQGFALGAGLDLRPAPYADPVFTPGMVVAAADRDADDWRTWVVMVCADGCCQWFVRTFSAKTEFDVRRCVRRTDLPDRLVVVGDDGRAHEPR